jgi:hypothetical protein
MEMSNWCIDGLAAGKCPPLREKSKWTGGWSWLSFVPRHAVLQTAHGFLLTLGYTASYLSKDNCPGSETSLQIGTLLCRRLPLAGELGELSLCLKPSYCHGNSLSER